MSSGSSGNCYLVCDGGTLLVVEAGIGVARIRRELARLNYSLSDLGAVVASHEHADHWSSAMALAHAAGAPVVCSPGTWQAGAGGSSTLGHEPLSAGRTVRVGKLTVEAFSLPHDAREPVGFVVRSGSAAVCLATDMGTAGQEMIERARSADLVILESNHDVDLLARGPYLGNVTLAEWTATC